jgi:hypothetical protein
MMAHYHCHWSVYIIKIGYIVYPTPSHFEKISQLPLTDDFSRVAEINVITAAVSSQIENVVEYLPIFHVVTFQLVMNPYNPSF